MLLVAIAGMCIIGGQVGINALAGTLYPTSIRATGTGWAFGVGRVGSILGPVAGGKLIAMGLSLGALFATAAAPILVSASAVFFLGRLSIVRNRECAAKSMGPSPDATSASPSSLARSS